MAQFAFLYVGGEVPDDKRELNMKEWTGSQSLALPASLCSQVHHFDPEQ